jgi:hypothetical protein
MRCLPTSIAFHSIATLALFLAASSGAAAQGVARASQRCDGRVVREIRVAARRPPFTGEAKYWRQLARTFGFHHHTTDTAVVRRFLAIDTGLVCTDFRLRESARLLREQPFLADARVRSVPDESGGVRVDVETVDEISAIVSASLGHGHLSYLEIGNENMFGDAWLLAVHGHDDPLEGRSAGVRASDYQFLNRPYQLDVEADWGQRSSGWLVAASHGYLTDLQRIAWETGIGHSNQEFLVLHRGEGIDDLALAYRRSAADIGGVVKLGNVRTPVLAGGAVTMTRMDPIGSFSITRSDIVPDTALRQRYPARRHTRLTAIGGWRNLNFVAARGLDALTATQDVPTGVQVFGQFGRGLRGLGGASDFFALADVLGGVGSALTYANVHLISEARREIGQSQWDGIISSSRVAFYWKPSAPNLVRAWTELAGGWRVLAPFQLGLATEDQRLIGYRGALVGGRRAAGGLEVRHVLSGITSRADIGAGAFVTAARLWAGDAPFGVSTPLLPSAGVSLFGAVPRGSQRLIRIDLGAPLRSGIVRSGWEVRFSLTDATRAGRLEPRDIARSREQLVGPDVFRP